MTQAHLRFHPREQRFVLKAPCFHHLERFPQVRIGGPQIQMCVAGSAIPNHRKLTQLLHSHCAVMVLGGTTRFRVIEMPRRISHHTPEATRGLGKVHLTSFHRGNPAGEQDTLGVVSPPSSG